MLLRLLKVLCTFTHPKCKEREYSLVNRAIIDLHGDSLDLCCVEIDLEFVVGGKRR